ncbi:MAG TPA: tetraacyldisaccharide 4'-kinase [Rhizomicrobium sp.]|nr:tetraacyldisaccharide 4'-kinase [Rhizomicrobium sp.]
MRPPEFWWRKTPGGTIAATALAPLGFLYGTSVAWKSRRSDPYRASVPVICIGNLTVGGTGKTPVAITTAQMLQETGATPVFILRGYARKTDEIIAVDPEQHDWSRVGDEALLLRRIAPTVVSRDRAWGARVAEALDASVIVMDDGHQNFSLAKDLSLVVVDAETSFGNGKIFPAGPLREPVQQGLARADAAILMGDGSPNLVGFQGPVLRARLCAMQRLDGRRLVAFAGIGRPDKFFATLRELGATLVETHAFADHHVYSSAEIARLRARATAAKATLMTTEKDFVRLAPGNRDGIQVLPVRAVFDDETAIARLIAPFAVRRARET